MYTLKRWSKKLVPANFFVSMIKILFAIVTAFCDVHMNIMDHGRY